MKPILILIIALGGCERCDGGEEPDEERPDPTRPLPREPGPPRAETPQQIERAREESRKLVAQLLASGIQRREVTAIADIRGYRFYKRRYFARARVWFEAAARTDPSYELSLYNAARAAALLGDLPAAKAHLEKLRKLGTPLAKRRLKLAKKDPDFKALRAEKEKRRP